MRKVISGSKNTEKEARANVDPFHQFNQDGDIELFPGYTKS